MKRLLTFAACCVLSMASFSSETSAQSIEKYGSWVRIELTKASDPDILVEQVNYWGVNYIRLIDSGGIVGYATASRVTNIWIDAKDGNDEITMGNGLQNYHVTIFAGAGNDQIDCGDCDGAVVYGDAGNDVIYGTDGVDYLDGGSGRDYVYGFGDFDQLFGGSGRDMLSGGSGNDWIRPGTGETESSIYGGSGADRFYIIPTNPYQAYQYPKDYNWYAGDRLYSVDQ